MRGKWVRTIVYGLLIALLVSCGNSCSFFQEEKPVTRPCNQESMDRTILAAKKAGCKAYKIEQDEQFKTCTFICYASQ